MNAATFLKQAVQHPAHTGALAPSSKRLSQMMVKHADLQGAKSVVELGPGTGAITTEILSALEPDTAFLGVERNPQFVRLLKSSFPGSNIICADAQDLASHLHHQPCDRIISGLPWAGFSVNLQNQLLSAISDSLCEQGLFLSFAYHPFNQLPRGRSFYRQLKQLFREVKRTEIVMNLPPASIYICTR